MRFTVQYIPLEKIKPGTPSRMTQRVKELRRKALDCMHLIIVRRSRKDGGYILLSGSNHLDYLKKHTRKKHAPCLIDQSKAASAWSGWVSRFRKGKLPYDLPRFKPEQLTPAAWSIVRTFMKQEPRYVKLTRRQQIQVLLLGLQYKKTAVRSMRARVDEILRKQG